MRRANSPMESLHDMETGCMSLHGFPTGGCRDMELWSLGMSCTTGRRERPHDRQVLSSQSRLSERPEKNTREIQMTRLRSDSRRDLGMEYPRATC